MTIIIMVADDTILFGTNIDSSYISIKYVVIIGLFFLLLLKTVFSRTILPGRKNLIAYFGVLGLLILVSAAYNDDLRGGCFYKLILLGVGLFYVQTIGLDRFYNSFSSVIYYIAVYSLIIYTLTTFIPHINSFAPVIFNTAGFKFYNYIFCTVPAFDSNRLYGPFREPGVYQMFLIITFLIFILRDDINYKKIVILLVSIILTYSTTGYIATALVLTIYVLGKSNNKWEKIRIIISIFIMAICLSVYTDIFSSDSEVFGKLNNAQSHSAIARYASITCNLEIFLSSPIFGVGLSKMELLFPRICLNQYGFLSIHNTNMLLVQFASTGLLYGSVWTYGLCRFFRNLGGNGIVGWLSVGVFIILCCGENLTFSVLFYILLFYGFVTARKSKF